MFGRSNSLSVNTGLANTNARTAIPFNVAPGSLLVTPAPPLRHQPATPSPLRNADNENEQGRPKAQEPTKRTRSTMPTDADATFAPMPSEINARAATAASPVSLWGDILGPSTTTTTTTTTSLRNAPPLSDPQSAPQTQLTLPSTQQNNTPPSQAGNLFGGPAAQTSQPTQIGGLFGATQTSQPQQSGGMFGNTQTAQPAQPAQTGGLFGSTQTSQPAQTGGLFGSTTNNQSGGGTSLLGNTNQNTTQTQGGGLFGNLQGQQPLQAGGLFGNATQNQQSNQTGGLFGNTQQNTTQTGGLFGSTQNNTQAGGLFGGSTTNQQQNQTGSLFGNLNSNANNQAKPSLFGSTTNNTGGGLFGSTTNNASGGLFGSTTANNNAQQQQPQVTSIFGLNAVPREQLNQSSLLGYSQHRQGTNPAFASSLSMGQGGAAPSGGAAVGAVKVDLGEMRTTTRFQDLIDPLKEQFERADMMIAQQEELCRRIESFKVMHDQNVNSIAPDVNLVHEKAEAVESVLSADAHRVMHSKKVVEKDRKDFDRCQRLVENLGLPPTYRLPNLTMGNSFSSQQRLAHPAGVTESEDAYDIDIIGNYLGPMIGDLQRTIATYTANLGEIEEHMKVIESSAVANAQQLAAKRAGVYGRMSEEDTVRSLADTLRGFEHSILGVAGVVGSCREGVTELGMGRMNDNLRPSSQGRRQW